MKKRIPLDLIDPNPNQPRKTFDPVELRELAASIREHGLAQAIKVRPKPGGRYEIVMGERRWRAHKLLAEEGTLGTRPTIKCEVEKMTDTEMDLQAIIENLQRADIRPVEEGAAYKRMLDRGFTVEKLAKALGISQSSRITARTALLDLDESVQSLVDSGQFPLGHANYLTDLPKPDQVAIVKMFSSGKLKDWSGVRAAAQAVRDRIAQRGMFGGGTADPSKEDLAALSRIERMVERIVSVIASGWKDGEFIAIKTVDPNKADHLADTLAATSRTLRNMEAKLREAHARQTLLN